MKRARALMLVSARADPAVRADVRDGQRPCPEYLRLEEMGQVEILDWTRLGASARRRTPALALRHAAAAARHLRAYDAVFSDGEHVGIPLAMLIACLRTGTPHLVIGHHLTTPRKRRALRALGGRGLTRILVHSTRQLDLVTDGLGIPAHRAAFIPYHADTRFWHPIPSAEEPLIVSAGREHRDYLTLARACAGLPEQVVIALGSSHSPAAAVVTAETRPPNVEVRFASHPQLRLLYAAAQLVVVPLVENDFQAGVTTLLEAMAMGKAVIVSATAGQRDIVEDGLTGLMVPPQDAGELRRAIAFLLDSPAERARLGRNARRDVERRFSLETYAGRLSTHLQEIIQGDRVTTPTALSSSPR